MDLADGLMARTTPVIRVTRRTLADLVEHCSDKAAGNPHAFASAAVKHLKDRMADELVWGIQYEKMGEWYEMQFAELMEALESNLVPAKEASLYDHVECGSDIERDFVRGLDDRADVLFYVKLPGWFRVPTPVGDYNPDWAIVVREGMDDAKRLYLVRETKGDPNDLRGDEKRKTVCGKKHFVGALGVNYKVIKTIGELLR